MASDSGIDRSVPAVVLGVSLVVSALLVRGPLAEQATQTAALAAAVARVEQALRASDGGRPAPARAEVRGRPDPTQRYDVPIGEAPIRGNGKQAKVTIVEFSDFQCPFCGRVNPTLMKILETYPNDVHVAFKHMPLPMHPQAPAAHAAVEAAHRQGRFWEMHDKIFGNQRDLEPATLRGYATELGLDMDRFDEDVASPEVKKRIDDDVAEAEKLNVSGTPAFFINGRFFSGAQPFESFKKKIDEELAKAE